jgi:clan AA aspartic protease (TIGR02281 family)
MKKIILLIVFISLAVFNSFSQTKVTMEQDGSVYKVVCKINGVPMKFIFDTGASIVSLSKVEAAFLLKGGHINKNNFKGNANFQDANGNITVGAVIVIDEIEFAGLKLKNVEASIVDNQKAPLLLGQSAIQKLGKIQLEGNLLTIMNDKNVNRYDFSTNSTAYEEPGYIDWLEDINLIDKPFEKDFTGTQIVFSFSPLLSAPEFGSPLIANVRNRKVQVLEKASKSFYKVKDGESTGYIWAGWFVEKK